MRRWRRDRERLQTAGELPAGVGQTEPATAGVYIDDLAGGCVDDDVDMPRTLRGVHVADVDLGELSAFAVGGAPLRRGSRAAAHCILAIAAVRAFGLEETPGKTEGGDVFVNLGLRLRLRDGAIDCPPPKRRILLEHLGRWRATVERCEPFERRMAERLVGRLSNLTQVFPELLEHMSAGHRAANAGYVHGGVRRLLTTVPVGAGSLMHTGLAQLLPHAIGLIEGNEGVPLAPRARFASPDDPDVLTVTTDASGKDGIGGWATLGADDRRPVVVSAPWPSWAREARRQFDLEPPLRTPGAPLLSMPAAELFATWAVAEAAATRKRPRAIIAVGDCDPAADALDSASSGTPQMSVLLAAARERIKFWLAVSIPREWNVDADRLSHPSRVDEVLADARAAGLHPDLVAVPDHCWSVLRDATLRAAMA